MKSYSKQILIIIPAFNEEKTIGKVLDQLQNLDYRNIIVVDDGSSDNTKKIALEKGAKVLSHLFNQGVGSAWRTGLAAAVRENADYIILMDADLQHKPEEVEKLLSPIIKGQADVAIGVRKIDQKSMPFSRRAANFIGNFTTFLLFGYVAKDSQSGFRAFNKKAIKKMNLSANKMDICSEMFAEIKKNNLRLIEIPISAVYTKYSLSKGQSFKNGIKTLIRLIALRFK